jgi:tRNA(Ile2) C34 agmatinyltransferase TiaS
MPVEARGDLLIMAKKKLTICEYCNENPLPKGQFRCDECAEKSVMDPSKKTSPAATIMWKQPGGEYSRRPYQ